MNREIYLDNAATTKPTQAVVQEMVQCLEHIYGNPSSVHRLGVDAERVVTRAREAVASILNASPKEVIFTAGGSESNNLAIKGTAYALANRGKHIITTEIEHASVYSPCQDLEESGFEVTYLSVNKEGIVNPQDLKSALRKDTILVTTMYVNNETGAIQPIEEIGTIIHSARKADKIPLWHVDAVQALGKIPLSPAKMGVNLLSLSAHKVHGPKGAGALYISQGPLHPQISGGGQEMGLRSGTENVPAIAGFGAAISDFKDMHQNAKHMANLRKTLVESILQNIPDTRLNGPSPDSKNAAPHIANISFIGVRGEVLLHSLEGEGIFVSTGSACSSRKAVEHRVLNAMGRNKKEIEGAIRFSLNAQNTAEEITIVIEKLKEIVKELRSFA